MRARACALGGYLPARAGESADDGAGPARVSTPCSKPAKAARFSTTMAFVRMLGNILLRDKNIGKQIVPIVPDESRTFGMEGMFRQSASTRQQGQNYVPQDADQLMFYREIKDRPRMLQEGINEPGAMSSLDLPPPATPTTASR